VIWGLLALLELRDRVAFKVWNAVFLIAAVLLCKDMLRPWPVYGQTSASVQVYFSPSCPGCQKEIEKLLAARNLASSGESDLDRVAFYPVALKPGDYERVEAFQNVLGLTLNVEQAFQACWSKTVHAPAPWGQWLTVRLGLLRNRMILARMGVNKIPLVVSGSVAMESGSSSGECGFVEGKDCDQAAIHGVPSMGGNL